MKKILILGLCTLMMCGIGCGKKSVTNEEVSQQSTEESATTTVDSNDTQTAEDIFTKAKEKAVQYEMNIVENGYKKYYWNAPLQYDEGYTQEEVEPKGQFSNKALEEFFGVTREKINNKISTGKTRNEAGDLEETVITSEDKYIVSNFDFKYYMDKDNKKLYQVCTVTGMDATKEIIVTWENGEVVNYEKTK